MELTPPHPPTHNLSFLLHLFPSVGKNIRSCLSCLYFHNLFILFSFELTCSHFRLSRGSCVEPLPDYPASTLSSFWDHPLYFQCVLSSHTHAKDFLFSSHPTALRSTCHAADARKCHFNFLPLCVCAQVSRSHVSVHVCECVCLSLKHAKGMVHVYIDPLCCRYRPAL